MTQLTSRPFAGEGDVPLLIAFEQRLAAARWPRPALWHVGDLAWNLYPGGFALQPGDDLRLWSAGGALAGFAWLSASDEAHIDIDPGAGAQTFDAACSWAEDRTLSPANAIPRTLAVTALDCDDGRRKALRSRGYEATETNWVRMRRRLDTPIEEPRTPDGIRLGDCLRADLDERAAAHRDAWDHLAQIGLPDARSTFSREVYQRLRAAPVYDASLDLIAFTDDGTIAACCICWTDKANGVGLFEPVGTRLAYRRLGLARALLFFGLRRLRDAGMRHALISTASFNAPALAAYASCGFEIIGRERRYEKTLPARSVR